MKKREFNKDKDSFLVFFTVTTANDFGLSVQEEVHNALRQEGIKVPVDLNQIINEIK